MRRSIATLALLVPLTFTSRASADADSAPLNAIQADLGLAVVGLAFERVLSRHVAIGAELHAFGTWFGPALGYPDFNGFGGQIRVSVFPFGDAPDGVYLSAFERLDDVTAQSGGASGAAWGASADLVAGYSITFARRFDVRLGAGAQYMSYAVFANRARLQMVTFFPALDLVVGCRF